MRVIRNYAEEIEKKVICKNCASELGYLPKDIQKRLFRITQDVQILIIL